MLTNRSENSIVILTEANLAEIAWKPKLFSWLSATYPQSGIYKFWTARISSSIHESLWIAWKKRDKNQRKDFHFQLFIQNQKSFFSLDGRIAFGWSIARPSISHRNTWRVNNLASEALRGHWKRPFSSSRFLLLYKRLDNGAFNWPRSAEEALEISSEQYAMFMQGLEIIPKHPIRPNDNPKRLM